MTPRDPILKAGPERLVMFTDAVAAIAITLLVLPLMEKVTSGEYAELPELIRHNIGGFGAFALSFGVIFRFWWAHHRLFRHLDVLSIPIVVYSSVWTFAVALLPIPTAIITAYRPSALTVGLYGGNLVLISASLSLMALHAYRHRDLTPDRPLTKHDVLGNLSIAITQAAFTVVGSVFSAHVNYWALLLMALAGPVEALLRRMWKDRATLDT